MKSHTKKGLSTSWGAKHATSRASRKESSAPTKEELAIYEQALRQAIKHKKNPRVLILGATPELRDLVLQYNCYTLAVDVSWPVLCAMHEVMKYKDHPANAVLQNDWLTARAALQDQSFDAILGDVVLNNIPAADHLPLLRDLNALLKRGGYFITRQSVYIPELRDESVAKFQRLYNKHQTYWLMVWPALGFRPDWKAYNPTTKELSIKKLLHQIDREVKKGNLRFRQTDTKILTNIKKHGKYITSIVFPKQKLEGMMHKYFHIKSVNACPRWTYTDRLPIYVLRKKTT